MKTFTDSTGRSWTIALNVETLRQVRDLCQIDLMEAVEGKLIYRLSDDPILLCDVVYALCKEEADRRQLSSREFASCIGGDILDEATTALLEEMVDFFPKRRRELLCKALGKMYTVLEKAKTAAVRLLESPELDRHIEGVIDEAMQLPKISGNSSGSSPDASG